jgi:aldehyde:ferredoxin oxidoreductase
LQPSAASEAIACEDRAAIMDSLILCKFIRGVMQDFYGDASEMLRLVTGWSLPAAELQRTALRIITAKKLFNVLAGWSPAEDTLPERFFSAPLPDDASARLTRKQLEAAITAYNLGRGWSRDGHPPAELLRQLGLTGLDDRSRRGAGRGPTTPVPWPGGGLPTTMDTR